MYKKIVLYDDGNLSARLERVDDRVFFHVRADKATKKTVRDARELQDVAQQLCGKYGYPVLETYTKDKRAIRLGGGWKEIGPMVIGDEEYILYELGDRHG